MRATNQVLAAHLLALVTVGAVSLTACGGGTDPSAANRSFFDSDVVHAVTVTFDDDAYEAMLDEFAATGDKDWLEASITIDGATYERVGLRLKGNSSLFGLAPGTDAAAAPEALPWLVRMDEYVEGQSHDGIEELVVRSNVTATALNEAVALELLDEAGLASQEATPVRFVLGDRPAVLRLAVEHPDDVWLAAAFERPGALYKAESTGDWSYRGHDPEAYDEVFDIEAGDDHADLTPLMDLLRFLDEADDATFRAELPERLDVEGFATYLAAMDLVENSDDIDGPGNNGYLYWEPVAERFTVVPWDMNLAFDPRVEDGGPTRSDLGGDNPLVDRFLAEPDFAALHSRALADLDAVLYGTGFAGEVLDRWVGVLTEQAAELVDVETIEADAALVRSQVEGEDGGP